MISKQKEGINIQVKSITKTEINKAEIEFTTGKISIDRKISSCYPDLEKTDSYLIFNTPLVIGTIAGTVTWILSCKILRASARRKIFTNAKWKYG